MPNVRILNQIPNIRISSFQTGRAGEIKRQILAGEPIGLLLALTYAENQIQNLPSYGDYRPNVRIKNI